MPVDDLLRSRASCSADRPVSMLHSGEPGDADAIIATSRLFAEMCATALAWEEQVRFAAVDPLFEPVRTLFIGVAGTFIDEATNLPAFISGVLGDEDASGTQTLNMVLTLPDGWAEEVGQALQDATDDYLANPK